MSRMVVVLPEPLGPRKPKTEPLGTARSTPSTASWWPNRLLRPLRLDAQLGHSGTDAGTAAVTRPSPAAGGPRVSPLRGGGLEPLQGHGTGEDAPVVEDQDVHQRGGHEPAARHGDCRLLQQCAVRRFRAGAGPRSVRRGTRFGVLPALRPGTRAPIPSRFR